MADEGTQGSTAITQWPDIADALGSAAGDPRGAEDRVVALAAGLPVRSLPEFFEHACRAFHAAGHTGLASTFLGRARKVEEAHRTLLGLAPDTARAHRTLLELVPTGVITPSLLHDHLAGLAARVDRTGSQAEAREIVEAFLAGGVLPYPNLMADLVAVAAAAGAAREAEEDWFAERLLRGGLLSRAALPVWEAAGPALQRLCRGSAELLDLLVAAEPAPGVYDDADLDARLRLEWLELLDRAGAGARLSRDWFVSLGPAPIRPLVRLAGQAADRLFPPPSGVRLDPGSDPMVSWAGAHPLAFRNLDKNRPRFSEGGPQWDRIKDLDELAGRLRDEPARFADDMDWFVRTLNHYANIDYPAALRRVWGRPELRDALSEHVRDWIAEASAGDLLGLEIALPHLVPLADAGHAGLAPEAFGDLTLTDPVDVLYRALRTGIPEELDLPVVKAADGGRVSAVQHGDLLTLATDQGKAEVHGPDGVVHRATVPNAGGGTPWYDGESFYLSDFDRVSSLRKTFRLVDGKEISFDTGALARWPDAPPAAQVTFPGAAEPAFVRLHRAMIHITAPDGTLTSRTAYSPSGPAQEPVLPPPGWWPRLGPADPAGSAALRGLTRETAEELVNAALRGPEERAAAIDRLLPSVTAPRLKQAIETLVTRATALLPQTLRLHDRLGTDRPERVPALIRSESGLRSGRGISQVVTVRVLAEALAEAAEASGAGTVRPSSGTATAYPLGTIALPPGTGGIWFPFGELGGKALLAAWPWTVEYERARLFDTLRAWGDTPWGDGSGRWRLHSFTSRGGTQKPQGELWRTPSGSLIMLSFQGHPDRESKAVEYSPDGRFEPFDMPGWATLRPVVAQGWGGAGRIAEFDRLRAERGPAPYDIDGVRGLAARTGLLLPEVASAAFGFPFFAGRENEREAYPQEILDLYDDPETGEPGSKTKRSYRLDRELREFLMPLDPADLWTTGLDHDRAAEWWETVGSKDDD
ncbi:hypothetical protein [Actinomadura rugatobispora]|uniref:DUF4132 domain-containing protein n=1 Tax=Actinomadura rugatobispora TaxID=1994 RepID=A0ABW1A8L2_9ACTN|nr:hypothetical protein GCM10010200_003830 [Actinomadura rugatobispora]